MYNTRNTLSRSQVDSGFITSPREVCRASKLTMHEFRSKLSPTEFHVRPTTGEARLRNRRMSLRMFLLIILITSLGIAILCRYDFSPRDSTLRRGQRAIVQNSNSNDCFYQYSHFKDGTKVLIVHDTGSTSGRKSGCREVTVKVLEGPSKGVIDTVMRINLVPVSRIP